MGKLFAAAIGAALSAYAGKRGIFGPTFAHAENLSKLAKALGAIWALRFMQNVISYVSWRSKINKAIPGPSNELQSFKELANAGLGEFWGFNAKLLSTLHNKHGRVVKLWLAGQLYISFIDCNHIDEVNKLAKGRPPLVEMLLPFLGKKNLLFQPVEHDDGKFMKQLRLRYGKMVTKPEALQLVHNESIRLLDGHTKHWGNGKPVNVFEDLKFVLYDIMGEVLFGGAWSENDNGPSILKLHRYLIEESARLGVSALTHPTLKNILNMGADYRRYQKAIGDIQRICFNMIEGRRKQVAADPDKWKNDETALTMLVTEKTTDGKPFFDKELGMATCMGFLNGAYDTTHITTFWMLYHLAANPEAQAKLQKEIDSKIGRSAKPTFEKCRDLEFLDAALKESIRVRQTVPMGMRVCPTEDLTIGGFPVPKGTCILPFTEGAHYDAKYFGEAPYDFRPERFMGEGAQAVEARKAFHGFGSHARMCVGFKFAEAELKAIFTSLLQRYSVGLADSNLGSPEMVFESGVNCPKNKFSFIFTPHK